MSDSIKSSFLQRPDYVVCTCMGVMDSEIRQSIAAGCTTFKSLSDTLMVGTGCNSCVSEVEQILVEELSAKKK